MTTAIYTTHRNITYPIVSGYTLNPTYLASIYEVIQRALMEHPRILVLRVDLHLPVIATGQDILWEYDTTVISRFVDSFKAQVKADLQRKKREHGRVHHCNPRYVWVKEKNEANQPHYHVALFLNKDTYFGLGDYRILADNIAGKVYRAWGSALKRDPNEIMPLVHFPDTPYYHLDQNSSDWPQQYSAVFYRLSYFAKLETKVYGQMLRNFGSSRG